MKKIALIFVLMMCGVMSCKKHEELDFNAQLKKDVETIDAYLATKNITNAVKDPSGVRYVVNTVGTGLLPASDSKISVTYDAYFLGSVNTFDKSDGTVLDLTTLIEGWQIVLPLMTKGSSFTIYIPSGLAYGTVGAGSTVPPNTNVMFVIHLLDDDAQLAADIEAIDIYLDTMNLDDNIHTDPSGFRYSITTLGTGNKPISTSTVTVTYTGKFFTSSTPFATQSTPISVPLAQLLTGWQLALPEIPAGSTFRLYLPSGLAYGPSGYLTVPANTPVYFDISMSAIN